MRLRNISLLLLCSVLASSAWGKVFLRWNLADVPSAESLGVLDLVIPWDARSAALTESARNQGYHVYTEVRLKQASEAAEVATKSGLSGILLNPDQADAMQVDENLRTVRARYPKLVFLVLDTNGKQPDMRGQTVTNREGILEVSSPTAQPWVDSNLALVRFDQTFRPEQPPLYSFQWDLSDPLQRQQGPSAEDYSLAVAEQGAFHADLVLDLHEKLQKDLLRNDPKAWATWNLVKSYMSFYSHSSDRPAQPLANVGAVMSDMETYYEAINLMARHNIPFRVLRPNDLMPRNLDGLEMLVVFAPITVEGGKTIADFAAAGRNVVLVNSHGSYPWHSVTPIKTGKRSVAYEFGKGRIVELSGPMTDPETFAQDIRRLMDRHNMLISLWNALTTLAVPYREPDSRETVVELVNYAQEPLDVQVQIAGSFSSAEYESPERGCCQSLRTTQRDGFTEFVVPELKIGGRVHLRPTAAGNQQGPARQR